MPAWLIPAIASALSTAGTIATNKANKRMADEQMRFQERMSSTAAQRSRRDFELAGLNPALAYQNTASTPGGSTATMDNPLERGISNARETKRFMADLTEQRERIKLIKDQAMQARANATSATADVGVKNAQSDLLQQQHSFNAINQPYEMRFKRAQAILQELLQPAAKGEAKYSEKLGSLRPALADLFGGARSFSALLTGMRK